MGSSLLQNPPRETRIIGNDTINSHLEKTAHGFRLIYRPGIYPTAAAVLRLQAGLLYVGKVRVEKLRRDQPPQRTPRNAARRALECQERNRSARQASFDPHQVQ